MAREAFAESTGQEAAHLQPVCVGQPPTDLTPTPLLAWPSSVTKTWGSGMRKGGGEWAMVLGA